MPHIHEEEIFNNYQSYDGVPEEFQPLIVLHIGSEIVGQGRVGQS